MNSRVVPTVLKVLLLIYLLPMAACTGEENQPASHEASVEKSSSASDSANSHTADISSEVASPQSQDNCDLSGTRQEQLARAREAAERKHEPDSLNCGSLGFLRLSKSQSGDLELQMEAATVVEESLFFLRVIQSLDLMGVNKINTQRIATIGWLIPILPVLLTLRFQTMPG
ncbi:MAG: hypothetical protein GKR93_00760 [Gammaproteobacteria bacterium]|nr:hypothetical protein [Gammaproteobacteria bacterium]